ncbi:MAG: Holliday junction resolvase RuvX [Holophagales bacterium]|jgi:putative Holliday junction resolvase|nr:Holliday junction resolvase RuvX [Holophagales bacterium]
MRWMAIDHGTKKVGIAFCDEMEILASPYCVWPMEENKSLKKLTELAKTENVKALLVGLPLHKDGTESITATLARDFGQALAAQTNLPLVFINEHLTSSEAKRLLTQSGAKPKTQSAKLDAAAAAVMLQEHLESRRNQGKSVTQF